MPIVMAPHQNPRLASEGIEVPSIVCDYCGRRIATLRDGVALIEQELVEPTGRRMWFAHHDTRDADRNPVDRCHRHLERKLASEGITASGWIELSSVLVALPMGLGGGLVVHAQGADLTHRDVWLLRWFAAGSPDEPLAGQPKKWLFRKDDALKLASRIKAVLPSTKHDDASTTEDDLRYGSFFDGDEDPGE